MHKPFNKKKTKNKNKNKTKQKKLNHFQNYTLCLSFCLHHLSCLLCLFVNPHSLLTATSTKPRILCYFDILTGGPPTSMLLFMRDQWYPPADPTYSPLWCLGRLLPLPHLPFPLQHLESMTNNASSTRDPPADPYYWLKTCHHNVRAGSFYIHPSLLLLQEWQAKHCAHGSTHEFLLA